MRIVTIRMPEIAPSSIPPVNRKIVVQMLLTQRGARSYLETEVELGHRLLPRTSNPDQATTEVGSWSQFHRIRAFMPNRLSRNQVHR